MEKDQKVYLHCKGGHGRSGIVVACILCHIYSILPEEALRLTTAYHSQRPTMRPKWREIGSPQTRQQKSFVVRMFKPMYFYRAYRQGHTTGFSNYSSHPVTISELGKFPTSGQAFSSIKE